MNTPNPSGRRQREAPRSTAQDQPPSEHAGAVQAARQSSPGARNPSQSVSPRSSTQHRQATTVKSASVTDDFESLSRALETNSSLRITYSEDSRNIQMTPTGGTGRERERPNVPESADRIIQIGVEAEFMMAAKHTEHSRPDVESFVKALANQHNKHVPPLHPRMRPSLRDYDEFGDYQRWCLLLDGSMGERKRSPWAIELVSPILKAFTHSRWREDVKATWHNLDEYYAITKTNQCSTHIHVSLDPSYSLQDIKRIAQAAIHFEPALEYLLPKHRRGNSYAKSNWLNGASLMLKKRSRAESVAHIEEQTDVKHIVDAIQRFDDGCFSWNFKPLLGWKKETIEFRQPPASTTAEEALSWAEFAMTFIQSSIKRESAAKLQRIPPHVGGLRWFLGRSNVAHVNEPQRLERIWAGVDMSGFVEPTYVEGDEGPHGEELQALLKTMLRLDTIWIQRLAKTSEPYW